MVQRIDPPYWLYQETASKPFYQENDSDPDSVWKVSKYGVFSGLYFDTFHSVMIHHLSDNYLGIQCWALENRFF